MNDEKAVFSKDSENSDSSDINSKCDSTTNFIENEIDV